MKIATDIGNSTTKMIVNDVLIKQPSVIKRVLKAPSVSEINVDRNIHNLFDELVVNITSSAIKRNGMYYIGNRANITADQVDNMNIKLGDKYKHDIPVLMTLSMIAAFFVKETYMESGKLPETIKKTITLTSAIPASEYDSDKARFLQDRFLGSSHVIIVYVGKSLVTVTLTFDNAKVTQEGVPALYALIDADNDILKQYAELYKKAVSPRDFADKKILHADIGDGTTEYIYTRGMNPVNDACSGERRGVGHATEEAIGLLRDYVGGKLTINRQQFMEMIQDDEHNLHSKAVEFMEEARYSQAQRILEDIQEKYMNKTAGNVDLILVYGGGSIIFKDDLYEDLISFANEVHCEVLWVPEEYAVDMNAKGMDVLNKKVLYKKG